MFSIEGHRWPLEPELTGSNMLSPVQIGASEAITVDIESGAGGRFALLGDYLYGDHREPYGEAGLWGLFGTYEQAQKALDWYCCRAGNPPGFTVLCSQACSAIMRPIFAKAFYA